MADDTIMAVRAKTAAPVRCEDAGPVSVEHDRSTSRYTSTMHEEHVLCGCFVRMPERWRRPKQQADRQVPGIKRRVTCGS